MTEEIKYPLDFTKCPVCGSERRVANEVVRKEKEKNKIPLDAKAFLFQQQTMVTNPTMIQLTIPVILTFYDACVDCGTVYCVHVEVGTGMPKAKPGGKPPLGNSFSPS